MKKVLALVIVFALLLSATPLFAAEKVEKAGKKAAEPSLFQKVSDTLVTFGSSVEATSPDKTLFKSASARLEALDNPTPGKKPGDIEVFESAKSYIATWNDSFANAKLLSLKDDKEELARRRGAVRY